ncbi:hypothetical protein Hanom_Chr04g00305021 [Helianthus anomalus]
MEKLKMPYTFLNNKQLAKTNNIGPVFHKNNNIDKNSTCKMHKETSRHSHAKAKW